MIFSSLFILQFISTLLTIKNPFLLHFCKEDGYIFCQFYQNLKTFFKALKIKNMKNILTACLMMAGVSLFAQDRTTTTQQNQNDQMSNPRTVSSSARVESRAIEPLSYDVNDAYMGRKDEFLNMMNVSELPSDFPLYDKKWGVKEYNGVVDAYFMNHMSILKDRVKEKVQLLIDKQQTK
jgi:hypothetical protein